MLQSPSYINRVKVQAVGDHTDGQINFHKTFLRIWRHSMCKPFVSLKCIVFLLDLGSFTNVVICIYVLQIMKLADTLEIDCFLTISLIFVWMKNKCTFSGIVFIGLPCINIHIILLWTRLLRLMQTLKTPSHKNIFPNPLFLFMTSAGYPSFTDLFFYYLINLYELCVSMFC